MFFSKVLGVRYPTTYIGDPPIRVEAYAPRSTQPTISKTGKKRFFQSEQNSFLKANKMLFSKRTIPLFSKRTKPQANTTVFFQKTIRLFQGPPTPILLCVVAVVVGVSRVYASLHLHCVVVVVSVSRKRFILHRSFNIVIV